MKNISIFACILTCYSSFAIKPTKNYIGYPDQYDFKYTESQIKTPDNICINLWDILPNKENPNNGITIVICGTDAGNMSYLLAQSLNLADRGFHVISFDYRGFGKSDNFKIDSTLLFCNEFLIDLETTLNFAKKKYPKNKIGTLGFSMGGYFSLITTEKLDFIIADSPLISPKSSIIRDQALLKGRIINLPPKYLEPNVLLSVPKLYFIGSQDKFVTLDDVPNSFAIVYKGGHLEAASLLQDIFFDQIEGFLTKLK